MTSKWLVSVVTVDATRVVFFKVIIIRKNIFYCLNTYTRSIRDDEIYPWFIFIVWTYFKSFYLSVGDYDIFEVVRMFESPFLYIQYIYRQIHSYKKSLNYEKKDS